MAYVDGFVLAVANDKKEAYRDHAMLVGQVFIEYGALKLVECWGDDVPEGKLTSFPMAVQCQENETVCLSWIWWPSKEARDQGMKNAMDDPRFDPANTPVPFDGKRMIFGGFDVLLEI